MTTPTNGDDADWLCPEPVDVTADTERPAFAGCYRIEAQGEDGVPFPSLLDATEMPPQSAEAEIVGAGGCWAQSDPDASIWVLTLLGDRRFREEHRALAEGHALLVAS